MTNKLNRRHVLSGLAAGAAALAMPRLSRANDPVKIGVLTPISAALAFVGQTNRNCAELALKHLNEKGGILGRPVEMVVEDTQMSTKTAVEKARKLAGRDGVSVLTGMVLPSEREAALSIAEPTGTLVLHCNNDEGRCHPNLITSGLATNQLVDPVGKWVGEHQGKTMFVVSSDLGSYRDIFVPRLKEAYEAAGGKVVEVQYFPFGTRDYAPVLQQIRSAAPELVWHSIGDDPITFVKQFSDFGTGAKLATALTHESIAAATQGGSVGTLGCGNYYMSIDTPENAAFIDAYSADYATFTERRVRSKVPILPFGEATYTGLMAYAAAAEIAGTLEIDAVREAYASVDFAAPRGRVTFDTAASHIVSPAFVGECMEDNSFNILETLGPATPICT
ncbi:ABC transporter substrate-binding protein [Pseudooceanicola sp. C21-150M6]|uniref:ABC transporter substrate-binding protein n=1 Tax=Pseudooceanicola sp. C21-150M6 TaxID=3434355 RepID=UPI003D7FEBF8